MAYRVLNTTPEIMSVDVETLKSRIDAHHYRPRFLSAADKVLNIKDSRPSALGQETHKIGQPADIRSYCDSGVPILNAKNVRPLYLNNDECPLVEKGIARKHKKQTLNGSEVLIVRTGAKCGDVAWASNAFSNYLVNSHVIPIRPKGNLESTFLAAYLSSTLGQMLLDREMTGAAQRQVSVASLNSTIVPLPDSRIQKYIGGRVELSEKCREEAVGYLVKAKKVLIDALGVDIFSPVIPKLSTNKPLEITSITPSCSIVYPEFIKGMIGAHAYAATHAQVELNLQTAGINQTALSSIVKEMVNGYDCRDFSEEGTPYAKVAEMKPGRLIQNPKQFVSIPLSDVPQKQRVKRGDLLVTRKGSFGICANATKEDESIIISSEIIRLELVDNYDSAYVSLFLNSNYGRSKFDRLATGTMMLGINHGNLSEIEIPILDTAIQKKIGDKCRIWQTILKSQKPLCNRPNLMSTP